MNLTQIKDISIRTASKAVLYVEKYSPQILTGLGIAGTIGTVVLAGRASIKAKDILDESKQTLADIELVADTESEEKYTEEDHKRDILITSVQTGVELAKTYAPTIGLAALSIGCFLGAEGILNKRYVAAVGLYEACNSAFDGYRKRIADIYGEDVEDAIYHNIRTDILKTKVKGDDGKTKTVTTEQRVVEGPAYSIYARVFDECNPNWSHDASQNKWFLDCQQNILTNKLKANGYLFLNDVYEHLGFKKTPMGQLVGWIMDGDGDGYIDFGLYDISRGGDAKIQFINAEENSIWLDFNVDGVIYELI